MEKAAEAASKLQPDSSGLMIFSVGIHSDAHQSA
jgi:hypothetical protein